MELNGETLRFIREHRKDDVRSLALQAPKYPDVDMPVALTQIAGRQAAAEKIPSWHEEEGVLYPRHLSLEQCSSEATILYDAKTCRLRWLNGLLQLPKILNLRETASIIF